jgi:hypothetical protein
MSVENTVPNEVSDSTQFIRVMVIVSKSKLFLEIQRDSIKRADRGGIAQTLLNMDEKLANDAAAVTRAG